MHHWHIEEILEGGLLMGTSVSWCASELGCQDVPNTETPLQQCVVMSPAELGRVPEKGTETCSTTWTWRYTSFCSSPLEVAHCDASCGWHWLYVVTWRPTSTSLASQKRFSARSCVMHGSIPNYCKCITFQCKRWLGCGSWLQFPKAANNNILNEGYAQQGQITLPLPQEALSQSTIDIIMLYLQDSK